jgi:hypothetical protein
MPNIKFFTNRLILLEEIHYISEFLDIMGITGYLQFFRALSHELMDKPKDI